MEDKIYFDKLAEILEEQFPKGECKERSGALVLNSYANIYHNEALKTQREEQKKLLERIKLELDVCVCDCGKKWSETDLADLVNQALKDIIK